jgi:hypothetical protein
VQMKMATPKTTPPQLRMKARWRWLRKRNAM